MEHLQPQTTEPYFAFMVEFLDSVLENLNNIVNTKTDLIVPVKNEIQILADKLIFYKNFVQFRVKRWPGEMEGLLSRIKDVTLEATDIILLLDDTDQLEDDKVEEIRHKLQILLKKMKFEEVTTIYVQLLNSSRSNLTTIGGIGFIESLLENLDELLNCRAHLVASLRHQIETVQMELQPLREEGLSTIAENENEDENLEKLWIRILDVVYQAEYIIDSFVMKDGPVWCHEKGLFDVIQEIKLINTEISDMKLSNTEVRPAGKASGEMLQNPTVAVKDDIVVGLESEASMIRDQLVTESPLQLNIVSIVGMPGLGKTTLARKVYNKVVSESCFNAHAWCVVSQRYTKKELFLHILKEISNFTGNINEKDEGDLAEEIHRSLSGKRYLIVLDDIWDVKAWNDLNEAFPDDENGSRILFTSRYDHVPSGAKSDGYCYRLRALEKGESWELLRLKLFQNDECPSDLEQVGQQIAENCQGLPLGIVVIAGLLARTEKDLGWWSKVANNLSSHVGSQEKLFTAVELSYIHLPHYLKPCFLYFGAFQEDEEIPIRKLIYLWRAEGFVREAGGERLDKIAQGYLNFLIASNLILVAQKRSGDGAKTCRVHDLLLEFCVEKAKKENFLKMIEGYGEDGRVSSTTYDTRRLCIYSKSDHCTRPMPPGPCVRTMLFFASSDVYLLFFPYSHIPYDYKLLRVLDMGCFSLGDSFPSEIELLVHLRYLAIRGFVTSLPPSIASLWNLETLIVLGLRGKVELPHTIRKMSRLRHICIKNGISFEQNISVIKVDSKLYNLETFSAPDLSGEIDMMLMRSMPSLRRLRCTLSEAHTDLEFLEDLESLNVSYSRRVLSSCKISFPSNLKKLTLSEVRLSWSQISTLVELSSLEVLKLQSIDFEEENWKMEDAEFSELKYLKLDTLNIVEWDATNENFPYLENLVLQRCNRLEKIPIYFAEINTLEKIEVHWCHATAASSAKKIEDEKQRNGKEQFKVNIRF